MYKIFLLIIFRLKSVCCLVYGSVSFLQLNLVGEKDDTPVHFCDKCGLPIKIYGRMVRKVLGVDQTLDWIIIDIPTI